MSLTEQDHRTITKARELISVPARDLREFTGSETQLEAYAVAFGRAQWALGELLAIIDRLEDGHG